MNRSLGSGPLVRVNKSLVVRVSAIEQVARSRGVLKVMVAGKWDKVDKRDEACVMQATGFDTGA